MATKERYIHKYSAFGRGIFPADMLRYDECWPSSTTAAMNIMIGVKSETREVTLYSYRMPTLARWQSFGWVVPENSIQRERVQ